MQRLAKIIENAPQRNGKTTMKNDATRATTLTTNSNDATTLQQRHCHDKGPTM